MNNLQLAIFRLKEAKSLSKEKINKWINYSFQSSSGPTEEFDNFYADFVTALRARLGALFYVQPHKGHFELHAYVQNKATQKYAYISIMDVRHFQNNWYDSILARTAEGPSDTHGGPNNWPNWRGLKDLLITLTK